ncbi:3506_t:CDS:10, partial [Funneliformis geosporum]
MSKNLLHEEYWTNTSVEDWSIESFDVNWIQQKPRLHHRSAQAHASLGNELSILARSSDQRIANKAQALQKQIKVNIKKTLVDNISESERKKKETRDINCLEKKSKCDDTNGEASNNSMDDTNGEASNNSMEETKHEEVLCRFGIMDLTPSSEFVLRYSDEDDYMQVLKETFEPVDKLFPESAIEFLDVFFSEQNCTHKQWDNKLDSLLEPEEDPFLKKLKRLIFETLPTLQNHDMLEDEFMNTYIHPVLKKALWRFSDIRYIPGNKAIQASAYRKSIMKQDGNADRSDGIAYTTKKQYEICVIEGSRPYVVDDTKEMSDYVQNARAGKDIINYTVVSEVKLKRAPPLQFKAFMVQIIGLSLRFYFMNYLGIYRLFEIETCEIPTDLEEINLFPSSFKAVVTWV